MAMLPGLKLFRAFMNLELSEQQDFVSMAARAEQANAIRELFDEIASGSMDALIAMREATMLFRQAESLQTALERRTVKPRKQVRDAEIVRLRDVERQSFGQIAKGVGLRSASAARTAFNRAKGRKTDRRK